MKTYLYEIRSGLVLVSHSQVPRNAVLTPKITFSRQTRGVMGMRLLRGIISLPKKICDGSRTHGERVFQGVS